MLSHPFVQKFAPASTLPDRLPADPFHIFHDWYREAHDRKVQPNPNAMSLATIDADGFPSVRIVLCRGMDLGKGYLTFYTNYNGRKGRALAGNPRACVNFHWDALDRQVRIEGLVVRSPAAESDEYFETRPWANRLSAWFSDQSQPIGSREELLHKAAARLRELGITEQQLLEQGDRVRIPRPPHWGGLRIWARSVELWLGGLGRFHDRAVWTRSLEAAGADFSVAAWAATRLQP
jgi:pyridoxamine 5'-phosphate oxidase